MSKETGGPAFPTVDANREEDYGTRGMTLRDYFATNALAGLCAYPKDVHNSVDDVARECYELADAMLAARVKP